MTVWAISKVMGTKARLAGVAEGSGVGIVGSGRGEGVWVAVGISAAFVDNRSLPSIAQAASAMSTVSRISKPTRLFT